jgi:predicted nuclease with TOPRIM domain
MTKTESELRTLAEDLRRERDELRVRMHLAKAEARDEWERLESRWEHVRARLEAVGHEAGKTAEDVAAALRLAAEELRRGYARLRALL